jgi:hypothetical protein
MGMAPEGGAFEGVEKEIGHCEVDLLSLFQRGKDLYGQWLDLKDAREENTIGRVQLGVFGLCIMHMVCHSIKKAYMDAFRLVVFGGQVTIPTNHLRKKRVLSIHPRLL